MNLEYKGIKKAVIKSQHCQRNWDLSKSIPSDDIELLIHAVSNCPSKQNIAHYTVHFITNRNVIEEIHKNTTGFTNYFTNPKTQETNSQVLANLLIVFEALDFKDSSNDKIFRNDETLEYLATGKINVEQEKAMLKDQQMSVGIAAGYVNIIASMIGYNTGCCACFDSGAVSKILNTKNEIMLLMGIGYADPTRNRREHQLSNFVFPTKKKQPIKINYVK
jgi:nitroreductase